MGKAEATIAYQVPGEQLPLLSPPPPSAPYLSQEEVVQQARAAPWKGLRTALLCLVAALFACMLATALTLLLKMHRPAPPLSWWQKAAFYHLPSTSFPDSNGDGHGDLEGVRRLLDRLVELPVQALVLGPVLEGDGANLSSVCSSHGSLEKLQALVADGHKKGIRILLELPTWAETLDLVTEGNRTGLHLKRALQFWQAQGVNGFLVAKDPLWRLDAVAGGLPPSLDLEEMLAVLLFSLPGTPLLQGGVGSPVPLGNSRKPDTNGHPLTTLYHSLLQLHANSLALQGAGFTPLPLANHSEDVFAFLRPGACSGILVALNLDSQPCHLNLSQPSFPNRARVVFSTRPEPQSDVKMEEVRLAPHQAFLLRVPSEIRP
ncbi:UNVERIFIED_CONTAM: hypothetical protein K2H54_032686 [Gekko kuhli]